MENCFATFVQLAELLQTIAHGCNLDFIELAGFLFSVTGDEGNRGAFFQQDGGGSDLARLQFELGGDSQDVLFDHWKGMGNTFVSVLVRVNRGL